MFRSSAVPELKFAVVGAKGSGKTTFTQRALDLKRPSQSPTTRKKMSLEGQVFLINLVEIQLEEVNIHEEDKIHWPNAAARGDLSHVDGVLALYDVTKQGSISPIPALLNACSKNSMPCVLIASKCDIPVSNRRIDPQEVEQLCMEETGIESVRISTESPENYKRCISVVLRNFLNNQPANHANGVQDVARPRAQTTAQTTTLGPRPQGKRSKHGRATSELSSAVSPSEVWVENPETSPEKDMFRLVDLSAQHNEKATFNPGRPYGASIQLRDSEEDGLSEQPVIQYNRSFRVNPQQDLRPESPHVASVGTPTTIANSFIDFISEPDSGIEGARDNNFADLQLEVSEPSVEPAGSTFEELVDRLLAPSMSRSDTQFSAIFLCLYRKFASPSELLALLWQHFESVQRASEPPLFKISTQLRHLAVLAQWLSEYPGDFAHPFLRSRMHTFLGKIAGSRVFEATASEMNLQLDTVAEDDDTMWACSDSSRGKRSTIMSFSKVLGIHDEMNAMMIDEELSSNEWDGMARNQAQEASERGQGHHSKTPSLSSSVDQANSGCGSYISTPLTSVEVAQRRAELLDPNPHILLTKVQWRQFMELSEDDIARELTRIDWILYSSIRPRDLIRHVSLTTEQRSQCKGLEHVNRMINQFNHVAFWVAGLILLRDKAKHRAKALEKFMSIAWKLRQLNNYNALGAITAGINGIAVHRLNQTRELVSSHLQKDFMRLEILMSTHRSHFAYRLAWENTSTERIAFLPLHRRDLVSAEEGNRTFIGGDTERINWRKFEIMGEVIVSIRESQGTPYPHINRNIDAQRLILEGRFSHDEDELYERSLAVEPPATNEARRRFNWFQR